MTLSWYEMEWKWEWTCTSSKLGHGPCVVFVSSVCHILSLLCYILHLHWWSRGRVCDFGTIPKYQHYLNTRRHTILGNKNCYLKNFIEEFKKLFENLVKFRPVNFIFNNLLAFLSFFFIIFRFKFGSRSLRFKQ